MALAALFAATMIVPAALGLHRYVLTGGSMSGTYDRGTLVFAEEVAVSELAVGDVITYEPPSETGVEGLVTHRVVAIRSDRDGSPVFRTKGDANGSADSWRFTLDGPTQPRVAFAIPYLGYGFAALSLRWVRMLLIGLPALAIAAVLLVRLWRDAGDEARLRGGAGAPGG